MGGGGGGEKKLCFSLLKSGKRQKAPLGPSASSHFVADCSKGCVTFCLCEIRTVRGKHEGTRYLMRPSSNVEVSCIPILMHKLLKFISLVNIVNCLTSRK